MGDAGSVPDTPIGLGKRTALSFGPPTKALVSKPTGKAEKSVSALAVGVPDGESSPLADLQSDLAHGTDRLIASASMLMPFWLLAILIEAQTFSVVPIASGMERIYSRSVSVIPFSTCAENPPRMSTPTFSAARSRHLASSTKSLR